MRKTLKNKKHIIEAVIFDFDGVILESSEIKTEAFLELFNEYPEHQQAIFDYHMEHQGITRYQKFKWIYETLLNREYTEEIREKLGSSFSALVYDKIMKVPFVPGAKELLKFLQDRRIPAFIASGTPDRELQAIVRDRSLAEYFTAVYGSDLTKEEIIEVIQQNRNFKNSEMLFVGDATTDYHAASAKDLPFIARNTPPMESFWKKRNVEFVSNLLEIPDRFAFV